MGQQERAVFIQSVPCLYHVVGKTTGRLSARSQRTQRQRRTDRERSRPQGVAKKPASTGRDRDTKCVCVYARVCLVVHVLTELKNLLCGFRN